MMEMDMDMESHGGVSIMKRLTHHRNYVPIIVALAPGCSWGATVRTRWLNELRPAGPPTGGRAGGPDSTCRGHWPLEATKKETWNMVVPPANTTLAYNSLKCRGFRWLLYQ